MTVHYSYRTHLLTYINYFCYAVVSASHFILDVSAAVKPRLPGRRPPCQAPAPDLGAADEDLAVAVAVCLGASAGRELIVRPRNERVRVGVELSSRRLRVPDSGSSGSIATILNSQTASWRGNRLFGGTRIWSPKSPPARRSRVRRKLEAGRIRTLFDGAPSPKSRLLFSNRRDPAADPWACRQERSASRPHIHNINHKLCRNPNS
jgi:hypothetical protein